MGRMYEKLEDERVRRGFPVLLTEWHVEQLLGVPADKIKRGYGDTSTPEATALELGRYSDVTRYTVESIAHWLEAYEATAPYRKAEKELEQAKSSAKWASERAEQDRKALVSEREKIESLTNEIARLRAIIEPQPVEHAGCGEPEAEQSDDE